MNRRKISFGGPGTLVAAAFIGPGTVTVCTIAGSGFGMQLLWALLLSVIVTALFQEMAARLGIVTRLNLVDLIRNETSNPVLRTAIILLVFIAIVIGNGAYEAGNISGGALGLDTFSVPAIAGPVIIGTLAFILLYFGTYKSLERVLVGLVILMSLSFLTTALLIRPNIPEMLSGLLLPKLPEGSILVILGLIGTTIVPYNLFLHASLAKTKWTSKEDIPASRRDSIISISIGGLVSMAIVITASSLRGFPIETASDMGTGLEPLYGPAAKYLISLGLFAAGITSAITAPLAAAYVTMGVFQLSSDPRSWKFRLTWMLILLIGVIFSSLGLKPIDIIQFAQVANGLLLPILGILILWLGSKSSLLGNMVNKPWQTALGLVFLIVILGLGVKTIWSVI